MNHTGSKNLLCVWSFCNMSFMRRFQYNIQIWSLAMRWRQNFLVKHVFIDTRTVSAKMIVYFIQSTDVRRH